MRRLMRTAAVALVMLATIGAMAMAKVPEIFNSGVPRGEAEVLGDLYQTAQTRLKAIVLEPLGTTQAAKDYRRARAAALVGQVDRVLVDLGRGADAWIGKHVPPVLVEGRKLADKQAVAAGVAVEGEILQGSFSQIDHPAVRIVARDIAANLAKANGEMGDRAKRVLRGIARTGLSEEQLVNITKKVDAGNRAAVTAAIDRRIGELVAQNLLEGDPRATIKQMASDLVGIYGETVRIIDKNGDPMEFDPKYYAEMVINTRTREASVDARHDRLREIGMDLVAITGRMSDNFCTAFIGQVFSLSGKHPKYPAYDSLPSGGAPFHVNCSKGTRAFEESLADKEQLARAEPLEDAVKLFGLDSSAAQKAFKNLQIRQQVMGRFKTA